ncbi:hypothetical protein DAEQUDRAFT_769049 [Daedalea quercina L-15889]|uniref:Uncharacterized protein n=1 Tax=Daedalea quercina L-15889 TaxID=1314783 RepID=A0A165M3R2_9APHY|nr:hypothetical protein DAEQUDRAFT_769049 [Daedalea quercina L-15889]
MSDPMLLADGDSFAAACVGLCCICCGEGFTSWMQTTRCCPGGGGSQAGCCEPCCKKSFDEDDWVEKQRARRRRASNGDAVREEPSPKASMEASRPPEVRPGAATEREGEADGPNPEL